MKLSKFIVYFAAGFFILYGLAFTIVPNVMSVLITGSDITGTSALIDFRATYGGMTLAVGIMILYLDRINQKRPSLVMVILLLMGMALGRTLGFWIDGRGNALMYVYLVLEILGSVLAFVALQKEKSA